jgi:hypothetical protein
MEYISKKTTELSPSEKQEALSLFNKIFNKERNPNEFTNQYIHNVLGYSFHILIKDKGHIIGYGSYVPAYYFVNGEKKIFVNGIDGFILKEYRDSLTLLEMIQTNRDYLKKNGVSIDFGFPNAYAMKVYTKGKLYTKIGEMYTYILPFRIGGTKNSLKVFNPFSTLFSRLAVSAASVLAGKKTAQYKITKDMDTYNMTRYKRMDGIYSRIRMDGFEFIYKIKKHR